MRYLSIALCVLVLAACDRPAPATSQVAPEGSETVVAALPGQGEDAGRTVIYRDSFGVPHIYAPTVEAGLYAQGWAQAEDRPAQLLMNLKIALGELTEIAGDGGVQTSLIAHMFGHMRNAALSVADMTETERNRLIAFANGITDFYRAHPEDVPPWWKHPEVTPEMIDAFGRMFLYNWSIDEAMGDLRRSGVNPDFVVTARARQAAMPSC